MASIGNAGGALYRIQFCLAPIFSILLVSSGIWVSTDRSFYLTDYTHHVVRAVDVMGIISTIAGTGESGNGGDDGLAVNATFSAPYAIWGDSGGQLFISDLMSYVVRRIDTFGIVRAVAGTHACRWCCLKPLVLCSSCQCLPAYHALLRCQRQLYVCK